MKTERTETTERTKFEKEFKRCTQKRDYSDKQSKILRKAIEGYVFAKTPEEQRFYADLLKSVEFF
jgi:hypothetical protein